MHRFWRNPLLILHVRADLRPARAAMAAALSLIVCVLIAMACWSANRGDPKGFWEDWYYWLMGIQFVLLAVWSAGTCGQAIARERELKTFDFLKTTRLTAAEIMVGKLLGAPIVAYFIVACTLPLMIVAGLAAHIHPAVIAGSIVLLMAFCLFYSLAALLGSMLVEKSSSGAVGLLGLLANLLFLAFADGPFKGFACISIVPALFSLYHTNSDIGHISATVFGLGVPSAVLTLALYVLLGAWLVLVIMRNLKRDLPQIQLLSRWQCVGLVAFWNLLFFAFLDTKSLRTSILRQPYVTGISYSSPFEIAIYSVMWNAVFLFLIGVAALSPQEKLKVWWRKWRAGESSYLAPNGLPWPWLVPAALAGYVMLAVEVLGLRSAVPLREWHLGFTAMAFGAFLVFTSRDVLFLQWCILTRMKHPVMKGILFIVLYNSAASLLGLVISVMAAPSVDKVLTLLIPYVIISEVNKPTIPITFIIAGVVLQLAVCALILLAIQRRLARPVHVAIEGVA